MRTRHDKTEKKVGLFNHEVNDKMEVRAVSQQKGNTKYVCITHTQIFINEREQKSW